MRIASWNLGHQTQERRLKPRFTEAISALGADVLLLNEYVHGETRSSMMMAFVASGLKVSLVSERVGRHNQILLASRYAIEPGDLVGPEAVDRRGQSNFLHVRIPEVGLEVVGLRVPFFDRKRDQVLYWDQLAAIATAAAGRHIVFIGDFNADPDDGSYFASKQLRKIRESGWQIPKAIGDWSFKSGT